MVPDFSTKVDACTQYETVTMVDASTGFESDYTVNKMDNGT